MEDLLLTSQQQAPHHVAVVRGWCTCDIYMPLTCKASVFCTVHCFTTMPLVLPTGQRQVTMHQRRRGVHLLLSTCPATRLPVRRAVQKLGMVCHQHATCHLTMQQ